jgi:UMF1 family MFS transporter
VITAASMAIIFFVSPLLGAMTDRAPRRMPFLVTSTLVCVFFTALLARFGFWPTAILLPAGERGVPGGDAVLRRHASRGEHRAEPRQDQRDRRGRGVPGLVHRGGLGMKLVGDKPLLFMAIAAAFLFFSIPCFVFVRERINPRPRKIDWAMVRDSTSQTVRTLRSGQQYPGLVRFLVGRVFYTDSINTVISVMALYTVNVAVSTGLTEKQGQDRRRSSCCSPSPSRWRAASSGDG